MISKGSLLVRPIGNLVQKRGMASVKNWKRPSMDEMLGPKEPWEQKMAQIQGQGWKYFGAGAAFLAGTIAYMMHIDFIDTKPNPLNWEEVKLKYNRHD